MTPDEVRVLRRLALNEPEAVRSVMSGDLGAKLESLDDRTAALVRLAAMLGDGSDPLTIRWSIDTGIASGVEDSEILHVLMLVAPIIGLGRITSAASPLLAALDCEVDDG